MDSIEQPEVHDSHHQEVPDLDDPVAQAQNQAVGLEAELEGAGDEDEYEVNDD